MKKFMPILFLCFLCSINCFAATPEDGSTASPLASHVFINVGSSIDDECYGGTCSIYGVGSGTMTITLQKQRTYDNAWTTYDYETSSKPFSGTSVCAHSEDRNLTSAGKYRCKTYVTASLGSYTDSRTVYSPVLTIY